MSTKNKKSVTGKKHLSKKAKHPVKTSVKISKKAFGGSKKSQNPSDAKPTLESILDDADRAFTDIVKKYLTLGETLVKAITFYGAAGKRAFKSRFPLTDNAIHNLELVGRGRLLPQFAMCSDRFVKGLVDMVDSITWQYKLLGASKNGMIRIRINGNIVDAKFTDLRSEKLVNGVLSIISAADKNLTPQQICEKLQSIRREVRSKFTKSTKPLFEISSSGAVKTVRFFRSKALTADDLRGIISRLEA